MPLETMSDSAYWWRQGMFRDRLPGSRELWPSDLAVVGFKMRPNLRQIDEAVNLAQEVIARDMTLKAKAIEQRLPHHPPLAHHGVSPRFAAKN